MIDICKDYTTLKNDKKCVYYQETQQKKVGVCLRRMKDTFLCHYSELFLGTYTGDSGILEELDLKNQNT